jgi:uncharacterized membrane protein
MEMRGKQIFGAILVLVGILFLMAAVGNVVRVGLGAALSNGLPYFGIGLLLLVAGRYFVTD